jgi:hypothetical protein
MTRTATPMSIRLTSAALAALMGIGLLAATHEATYTGAAGLPVVELERVVVTAAPALASVDAPRPLN